MPATLDDNLPPLMPPTRIGPRNPGTSSGLNIAPGSDDDGWIVPHPVRLGDGTHIQLHKDGEALHAAYQAIQQARRRVCVEVYIFASDDTGRAFADLLAHKARNGLDVHVIYDAFGSVSTDPAMFDAMRRAGVRVLEFHPLWPWIGKSQWRPVTRNHRKLLLIDDDIAGMGGLNVASEYAGSWVVRSTAGTEADFWRDTAIGIRGPAAKTFLRSFARTWHYLTHRGSIRSMEYVNNIDGVFGASCPWPVVARHHRNPHLLADTPEGPGQLGVLASVPQRNSPLRPMLKRLFRAARHSIAATMAYFAPHDDLIDELCLAARRGVKVRLMLPGKGDIQLMLTAARAFYDTLMTAGVQIFERQEVTLHAKTLVIDSMISMVGSTNMDFRSIEHNLELSAIIRSREFGQQLQALFEHDVQHARRIWPHQWRHRPVRDRLVQWLVSRARYLL